MSDRDIFSFSLSPQTRSNRTQQVSHISRQLKNLARELQAPIIALTQLSRSFELRNLAIPVLSDLRGSGSIEQDADSVMKLYRESMYNEDCEDRFLTEVYLRKNRHARLPGRTCISMRPGGQHGTDSASGTLPDEGTPLATLFARESPSSTRHPRHLGIATAWPGSHGHGIRYIHQNGRSWRAALLSRPDQPDAPVE